MGNRLNVSHGAPQNQASFIVDRGWKSSNSSPLPVEGEVFFLTFPFIDQAFALRTQIVSDMAMFRQQSSGPLLHRPKALSFSSAIVGNYAAAVKAQNGGC